MASFLNSVLLSQCKLCPDVILSPEFGGEVSVKIVLVTSFIFASPSLSFLSLFFPIPPSHLPPLSSFLLLCFFQCRDVRTREVGIQEIHHKVRPYQVSVLIL